MLTRVEEHIRDAKLYKDGKLTVNKNLKHMDIQKGIDWDYKSKENTKTFQVYLHSLNIVKSLVSASKRLKDESFLDLARDLIMKWHSKTHNSAHSQAWHEHAVSSRLNNIIFFQERSGNFRLDDETYQQLLLKHCKHLSLKRHYKENNHGIMMDNSLIGAAQRLTNKELKRRYLEIAYYRVKMAFYRDFSKMGVHLENSPEYHKMVLNLMKNVSSNLKENRYSLGDEFTSFLNRANHYTKSVVKPNGELPTIGDSSMYHEKVNKSYKDFIDSDSGIFISQYKNETDEKNSTWMLFKSGYRSKTHKHKDDLSIFLYMNGHDILIDSGKYSYNIKDPIRKYIVSPQAHSTIYLRDNEYKLTNPYSDQIKLRTTRYASRNGYKVSAGINNLYPNTNITRNVVLTNDNILIVSDMMLSQTEQEAVQNFVLPETASVNKINNHTYEVTVDKTIYVFTTHMTDENDAISSIEDGYVSYKFNTYEENKRIEFTKKGKRLNIVTTIHEKSMDLRFSEVVANRLKIKLNHGDVSREFLL